jgi:hypothetical protein
MEGGGAFEGAKEAGYSASQAAAMAGKLEGSYEGTSGKSGEAHAATAHAERTKSKSAHLKAAAAHREAASHHEEKGNEELATAHRKQANMHRGKASRATRNAYNQLMIANCSCEEERRLVSRVIRSTNNTLDTSGDGSDSDQAGDEEESDDHGYKSKRGKGLEDDVEVGDKRLKGEDSIGVGNSNFPGSISEYLQNSNNQAEKEAWDYAVRVRNEAHNGLIRQLVTNVHDEDTRRNLVRNLRNKSISELQELLAIKGSPAPVTQQVSNFMGAAGVDNSSYGSNDDVLELPKMTFNRSDDTDTDGE